jgi:hypothetical protein
MNGFAPLLEGFLAFALTMVALTTGVSAIVGAINHLRRKHARGLRDMVRLLYLREIVPLLDGGQPRPASVSRAAAPDQSETNDPDGQRAMDAAGLGIVMDMNGPVLHARETLDREPIPTANAASPIADPAPLTPSQRRAEFIYDMTFMPLPVVVERLEREGPDCWRNQLESAERLAGERWYEYLIHPKRVGRFWRSLRYSLECLQDGEFRERLASSDVGAQLKAQRAWEARGLANWEALVEHLLKKFQVIGSASSETFARHSRGWCVAVGFVLAALLNIDSLDLLNSYLTNPDVRQRVLDRSDAILAQETPAAATDTSAVAAPVRERFDAASTQLTNAARELSGTLEVLRSNATGEGAAVVKDVAVQLEKVAAQVKDVQGGVNDLETDVTLAEQRIRGVTRSLTASFPIGWKRFPNCSAIDSPDVRCQGRAFASQADRALAPATALATLVAAPTRWSSVLMSAQAADPDAFNQWVVGVLLTGLLLGLGTPFWVQAVSTTFNLRRWDPKKADSASDATATNGAANQNAPGARNVTGGAGTPAGA